MPTSNGQVGSRDIRQNAVRQLHVFPAAIDTAELADLAASIDKVEDPIFVFAGEGNGFRNVTVNTTFTELDSLTVTIPSFVGIIHVFAIAYFQLSNSSGSKTLMAVSCRVNDEDDGGHSHDVSNNETAVMTHTEAVSISTPGSTVKISNYPQIGAGTNTSNQGRTYAIVLGER